MLFEKVATPILETSHTVKELCTLLWGTLSQVLERLYVLLW